MTPITKYQANDGSVWSTELDAVRRDSDILLVAAIIKPLKPQPSSSFDGYIQQDRETVLKVKGELMKIASQRCTWNGWSKDPSEVHPMSYAGRAIDDIGGPLSLAWYRIMCTDEKYREWEQPYYAMNPGTGVDKEVSNG